VHIYVDHVPGRNCHPTDSDEHAPTNTATFFGLIVLELMIALLGKETGVITARELETVLME